MSIFANSSLDCLHQYKWQDTFSYMFSFSFSVFLSSVSKSNPPQCHTTITVQKWHRTIQGKTTTTKPTTMWNKRKEQPFHHTNKDCCVGDTTPKQKKDMERALYHHILFVFFPISLCSHSFSQQFSSVVSIMESQKKGSQSILILYIYCVCSKSVTRWKSRKKSI